MSDSPRKEKKEKKEKKRKGNTSARNTEPQLEQLPEEDFGSGPVSKASLELKDCPVQNVTVYNDRAEVTRIIKTNIKAGTTEMSVNGISSKVDSNSVRVAGGKGAAVILEVSHNVRWEPKNKDDGTEQGRLKREQEELDEKIAHEQEVLNRIAKEDDWVEKWGRTLSTQKKESDFVLPEMMKQAADFMDFYHKKLADIDERRANVNKSLKELREQRGRVTKSLAAISGGDTQQVHEVLVLLAAKADTDVELVLSYVVMGAAWHAAYDVRVESAKDRLDLVYYGFITNNSLDNWEEAPLSLSTAKPSVGGAPPDLTTKFVGFRSAHVPHLFSSSSAPMFNRNVQRAVAAPAFSNLGPLEAEEDNWQMDADEPVQVMTSAVQESGICTSFAIPRKTTILSDNKPHKVTIRMVQLKANFTYVIIPKLSAHAYLKASILNASEYPFLPGDINVFMDGNFVAKSTVPAVSPNETFSLFLGTDDAIKVTYPPGALYKETQGILKRSNLRTTKHTITIKNTKSQEVSVVIFDQLPKSNDSQIKVKLHKPTIVEGNKDIELTEANNVKWKKDIPSGKEIKLPFEYSIEWPAGQELTM